MFTKIKIALHDDWELRGDGVGDVADLQYLPMRFYISLASRLGLRLTFMADVQQQLCFLRYAGKSRIIDLQAHIWEESLLMAREAGHDVQLHIHPQWLRATYCAGMLTPEGSWDISAYSCSERVEMLSGCIDYLQDLMKRVDPAYKVVAFKAGGWALRSGSGILADLQEQGIRLVLGPGSACRLRGENFNADYTEMEEDTVPYLADLADPCRIARRHASNIVVLPLPFYRKRFLQRIAGRVSALNSLQRVNFEDETERMYFYWPERPVRRSSNPAKPFFDTWKPSGLTDYIFRTSKRDSLDISVGDFNSFKMAIDSIIKRYQALSNYRLILPLQTHTKAFRYNPRAIESSLEYLVSQYGDMIEFNTLAEVSSMLTQGSIAVRCR